MKVLFWTRDNFVNSQHFTRDPRQFIRDPRHATIRHSPFLLARKNVFASRKKRAFLLSALPHCRIFYKSTATREWLTCIVDILKLRNTFLLRKKKRRCNHEIRVLNGHTKRQLRQREKLPVRALHSPICRQKNFPPEYFLAADRRDIYIIKGDKNLIAFISLLLIQKKCIQKIIFLKMVCFRVKLH